MSKMGSPAGSEQKTVNRRQTDGDDKPGIRSESCRIPFDDRLKTDIQSCWLAMAVRLEQTVCTGSMARRWTACNLFRSALTRLPVHRLRPRQALVDSVRFDFWSEHTILLLLKRVLSPEKMSSIHNANRNSFRESSEIALAAYSHSQQKSVLTQSTEPVDVTELR
jgi:hypothetical protein